MFDGFLAMDCGNCDSFSFLMINELFYNHKTQDYKTQCPRCGVIEFISKRDFNELSSINN